MPKSKSRFFKNKLTKKAVWDKIESLYEHQNKKTK